MDNLIYIITILAGIAAISYLGFRLIKERAFNSEVKKLYRISKADNEKLRILIAGLREWNELNISYGFLVDFKAAGGKRPGKTYQIAVDKHWDAIDKGEYPDSLVTYFCYKKLYE
jgi:hypothetical protein